MATLVSPGRSHAARSESSKEVDIDGYRCDVAGFVPTDFWDTVRAELDSIKPVFMLAEWEARDLHAINLSLDVHTVSFASPSVAVGMSTSFPVRGSPSTNPPQ